MMFLDSFKIISLAVGQIILLGAIGYFLVKKNILSEAGLSALSRLVIEITLPILIFCQLVKDFSFRAYPDWWIFPLLSIAITAIGLLVGALFLGFFQGTQHILQFLSLVAFQNSGYLPLVLVGALLPAQKADTLFIYLFLFLLGFNLLMFSLGVHMLVFHKNKKFELASLFSPPVIAVLFTLLFIFLGLARFTPAAILKPLRMAGDCTLPLSMFVVGGNLAQMHIRHLNRRMLFFLGLTKLILMPLAGLFLAVKLALPELVGLLIVMQLAMPPATLLSVIVRHYHKEDFFISQGIFWGHIISMITIPLFLSLYFALAVVK